MTLKMKRVFLFFAVLIAVNSLLQFSTMAGRLPSTGQGLAYYKAGFPAVAKPLLLSEIQTETGNIAEVCFNLGNIYFNDNQLDSASFYYNKGLAANPANSLNAVGLTMLKIKSNPTVAATEFTAMLKLKANKKNPEVYLAIANAYLYNNVIDQASFYADKARVLKKNNASVFVVIGDIEVAKKQIGEACRNYEQAIYADGKCKEAYIKYARAYKNVNATLAIEKLMTLKQKEPDFLLADRELADTYYSVNDFGKAADSYGIYMKSGNFNIQDMTQYGLILFFAGRYNESLEQINSGLVKMPRNPAFNRLALYNYVDLRNKKAEALKAGDALFTRTDNPVFTYLDYRYYGKAFADTNMVDQALEQYNKAMKIDSTKADLWKELSDLYVKKTDNVNALVSYEKYVSLLAPDKVTNDVLMDLGKKKVNFGGDMKNDSILRIAQLNKADSIFANVAKNETNYRGNYWRAQVNNRLDPTCELGLAKPYYEQTATFIEAKSDAARFNKVLVECYSYLGYYYLLKNDADKSRVFWTKLLAIDPTNKTAKKAMEGIDKIKKAPAKPKA